MSESESESNNGLDNDLDAMTNDLQDEPVQSPPERKRPRGFLVAVIIAAIIGVLAYSATGLIVNTKRNSESTSDLVQRLVEIQARIEDCSTREGKCYQENQKATGEAIQAILNGIQGQINPHRLRNEAENLCQVYIFAGNPPVSVGTVNEAVRLYQQCVLERSGGTEAPPLPTNPFGTTTTTIK